jgi:putative heme transporter
MTAEREPVPRMLVVAAAVSWRLLLVAAAVVIVLLMVSRLSLVVMPVIVALLLTTLLEPAARGLESLRFPRALAALTVVMAGVGIVVALGLLVVPQLIVELGEVAEEFGAAWGALLHWLETVLGMPPARVEALLEEARAWLAANVERVAAGILAGAVVAVEIVVGVLLSIVLTFFFVKDGERIVAWILERIPHHHRADAAAAGRRAWATLAGYIQGTAIVALADAVGIGLGLLVLGVPLVLPLATLTFLGGFFPLIGATVAGFLAVLVALITRGVVIALLTLAVVIAVQQLESNVLEPVVLSRKIPLHPVPIVLGLTVGGVLAGMLGAFLAVPSLAVTAGVANELRLRREGRELRADVDASGTATAPAAGDDRASTPEGDLDG